MDHWSWLASPAVLLVSFVASLVALCQYIIVGGRVVIRRFGPMRCLCAAGALYGLYVIAGNALQPAATAMKLVFVVDALCTAGTVVIVVASATRSYRHNHRGRS
jgi:hypothetical protein